MTANPGSATAPAATAQIGVTGLAVMGRNLARNFARNGFTVAVHNRSYARTESLMADHASEGNFVAAESLEDFVASLVRPRTVVVMVRSEEHTSELQSRGHLVCRLLLVETR